MEAAQRVRYPIERWPNEFARENAPYQCYLRKQLSHQITRSKRASLAESIEAIERLNFSLYNVSYGD